MANEAKGENVAPFRKTFNRSERTALLALAELFKQHLLEDSIFDFRAVSAMPVSLSVEDDVTWLQREIILYPQGIEIVVTVRTESGQGYSEENPSESIFWTATRAVIKSGGFVREFQRRRYPEHAWWVRVL